MHAGAVERSVRIPRRIDVRRELLALPVIALLAGCGAGSTGGLAETYARFSEGFGTADLKAARLLLGKPIS